MKFPVLLSNPVEIDKLDILLPQKPDFIRPPDAMWASPEEAEAHCIWAYATDGLMKYVLSLLLMLTMSAPALAEASFEEAVSLFEQEFKSAREIAEPLANNGDTRAMAMMGAFYQTGSGAKLDLEKAVSWFTKAAEKDHPGAQFSLAMLYLDGSLGMPMPTMARSGSKKPPSVATHKPNTIWACSTPAFTAPPPEWPKAMARGSKKSADQGFP